MDPLAHTLVGAALGRAVAGRDVPAAAWIGAIAANAPDWSELVLKPGSWPPRAGVEYLVFHRGITHSFLGAAVEILVLTEALSASTDSAAGRGWAVARHLDHPAVRAALDTPQGHAIAQFARFLAAAVDSSDGGMRVSLWDVRYHAPGSGASCWAAVQVQLRRRD